MNELFEYLNSIYPLSKNLKTRLDDVLKEKIAHKKEVLLKQGQISKHIYFIKTGLIRCYYLKDSKEVSSWFMHDGDIIISVESFFMQKVSVENIQVLEDSILYYITYDELQSIYKEFLEFNFIGRVILEKYYSLSEQRVYFLRMHSAVEKYNYMLHNYSYLIQKIPSKYIASYLGITLETLSRIKKKKLVP